MNHRETKVAIARITRGGNERSEIGTWLVQCYSDPVVDPGTMLHCLDVVDAEPTSASRAKAVLRARAQGYQAHDVLIQIDNDMVPPDQFYNRAVRFLHDHQGPIAFASPYCGAPPKREVQVVGCHNKRYLPHEAAGRRNIEQVISVGFGIFAANMAAYELVEKAGLLPWFDYEFSDPPYNSVVASTEDIYFCNRLNKAGGKVYVDWESWSLHAKTELVGPPEQPNCVTGWTQGMENFYLQMVSALPDGATWIEVGVFEGRSLVLAGQEARRHGKSINFVAVDHFQGSPELAKLDVIKQGRLREAFQNNLRLYRLENQVHIVPLESTEAAALCPDAGADFVFLDAAHDYDNVAADIRAWLPKVKPGGILAGHDWYEFPGVQQAVKELLEGAEVMENCWLYRVPAQEVIRA